MEEWKKWMYVEWCFLGCGAFTMIVNAIVILSGSDLNTNLLICMFSSFILAGIFGIKSKLYKSGK
ncbi:MAG: hypothetical protein N3F05_01955 [Candidatus Diapherotrites archaeon]|nr:hypothetical protein [Candidatus Diapherotrites archaeon]